MTYPLRLEHKECTPRAGNALRVQRQKDSTARGGLRGVLVYPPKNPGHKLAV